MRSIRIFCTLLILLAACGGSGAGDGSTSGTSTSGTSGTSSGSTAVSAFAGTYNATYTGTYRNTSPNTDSGSSTSSGTITVTAVSPTEVELSWDIPPSAPSGDVVFEMSGAMGALPEGVADAA
ncbi:MAG TPA: hypothetical protein VK841_19895, partial [Polyangiaceae bacterium]|nr:hypothetical protein [Polyangiaceae bacterium]